ncbi:MAG: polysaccharide biosynthesis/export family protein, partial [Candidatus Aminicenantes bacterium]
MKKMKELVPFSRILTREKLSLRRKSSSPAKRRIGRLQDNSSYARYSLTLRNVCFPIILSFFIVLILTSIPPGFAQDTSKEESQNPEKEKVHAFGYDIFRKLPEPITEGPVDENYLLSPGDEIMVTVWGQLNLEYSLTVSEEGYITIPDEGGRVFTNGVSLKELKSLIAKKFSQIYSSYINVDNPSQSSAFVDVKLAKVRKLLVYIVGEVDSQGAYTISSSVATLLNLLNNAGGIKETGSLRKI